MAEVNNVGFRAFSRIERVAAEVAAGFATLETTCVTDAMHRFGSLDPEVQPVAPGMRLCGPAVTVRLPPGDNLMVYKAFELARPGDVLVLEARGLRTVAHWGDLTSQVAAKLGLGGMVTDGVVRDIGGIRDAGLPVFARPGFVANGGRKNGPGEVNVPVAVGGVPILPGDLVLGDDNGVVIVPRADAEAVLARARKIAAGEEAKVREIQAGNCIPDWLAPTLARLGCEIVEEG